MAPGPLGNAPRRQRRQSDARKDHGDDAGHAEHVLGEEEGNERHCQAQGDDGDAVVDQQAGDVGGVADRGPVKGRIPFA